MPRRLAPILLFGGGLLLLVSLYMPWQVESFNIYGWTPDLGSATALFALLLAAVAGAALGCPRLADRLPLGLCGLLAGYFGLAAAASVHAGADQYARRVELPSTNAVAYGGFVALAGMALLLLAAFALRSGRPARLHFGARLSALVLGVVLALLLLVPWTQIAAKLGGEETLGVARPPGSVAAALAVYLLVLWWRDDPAAIGDRLAVSAAVALFAGGAASTEQFATAQPAAWIGIGIALALVVVAAPAVVRTYKRVLPAARVLATAGAAGLFAASLFMPWEQTCLGAGWGPLSNRCLTTHQWSLTGSTAMLLALALLVVALDPGRLAVSSVELAAGLGLMMLTLAFGIHHANRYADPPVEHAYGIAVGFLAATALIGLALAPLRPRRLDWSRAPARIVPLACSGVYLAIVALPWLGVLSLHRRTEISFGAFSWLTIAGALLGIRLILAWARRIAGDSSTDELILLPFALLALASLDLIRLRSGGVTWGGGIVIGLCLLLALLGHVEREGGVRRMRIPEVLRVDRI